MSVISIPLYPCDYGTGKPHQGWHDFRATTGGIVCRLCGKPSKFSPDAAHAAPDESEA